MGIPRTPKDAAPEQAPSPSIAPEQAPSPYSSVRLTVLFGGATVLVFFAALVLGIVFRGDNLQSAVRSLTVVAAAQSLLGATALLVAHFYDADWAKQLEASGKLTLALAALIVLIFGLFVFKYQA